MVSLLRQDVIDKQAHFLKKKNFAGYTLRHVKIFRL